MPGEKRERESENLDSHGGVEELDPAELKAGEPTHIASSEEREHKSSDDGESENHGLGDEPDRTESEIEGRFEVRLGLRAQGEIESRIAMLARSEMRL